MEQNGSDRCIDMEVNHFITWCNSTHLQLHVSEMCCRCKEAANTKLWLTLTFGPVGIECHPVLSGEMFCEI